MIRNLLRLLRLLPQVNAGKSFLFALNLLATALLPVGVALLTGLLVGSIPGAVAGGFESAGTQAALRLLAAVAALVLLLRVLNPLQAALAESLGRELNRYLQERVMAAAGRPSGIAHLDDPEVLNNLRAVRELGIDSNSPSLAVTGLAATLPAWIQALGSAAVLFWFHWWLGLTWLIFWPLVVFFMQREYLKVGQVNYGQSSALRRAEYLRDLALTAGAAKELRLWGMLDWLLDRFEAAWRSAIEPVWKARRPSAPVIFGATGGVILINALSYALLAWSAVRGELSLGALAVFLQALVSANGYSAFNDSNAHLSFGVVTIPKILELDEKLNRGGETPAVPLPDASPEHEIRFEEISFRYPGAEQEALRRLNLTIPAGRSLAIVGDNGAGKSSLVKLLCGLYEPTAGCIQVDGIPLSSLDPTAWRKRIAVLFQDFTRYQLSVRENIAFGAPELASNFDRLRSAAARAGALELIEALPASWDTILSPEYKGGVDLSGGQWQRIALARALFAVEAGARLLILDEPTAALDVRAEAELYDRFLEITKGLTTILISHRFSTVRRADRIVVLSDGAVLEEGTHEALCLQGGRYAHLFQLQAARFSTENGSDPVWEVEAENA